MMSREVAETESGKDPALDVGPGWTKTTLLRKSGKTEGKKETHWLSPGGRKFRTKAEAGVFQSLLVEHGNNEVTAWKLLKEDQISKKQKPSLNQLKQIQKLRWQQLMQVYESIGEKIKAQQCADHQSSFNKDHAQHHTLILQHHQEASALLLSRKEGDELPFLDPFQGDAALLSEIEARLLVQCLRHGSMYHPALQNKETATEKAERHCLINSNLTEKKKMKKRASAKQTQKKEWKI